MARKHTAFRFGNWHEPKPQPNQEYIQSQTTWSSGQLEITHGEIDRAKDVAADEGEEADMPSDGLVKEEEVISDIEGARPGLNIGFGRPPVL